jgi:predicted deacylase
MRGTFLGVPVCNPPALLGRMRTSPLDGLNLARVFPGDPAGSPTRQIAHLLESEVIRHGDFVVDLHSSGTHIAMPLLVGYWAGDQPGARRSREAAERFGLPVLWAHVSGGEGRSISECHKRGVPWLYTESPSGGWLHSDVAARYAGGVENVMRYLGILPGEAQPIVPEREIAGEGDIDESVTAPVPGFLVPRVELLEAVAEGDVLGTIEDVAGDVRAEVRAPFAGTVVLRRNTPVVDPGDLLFLVT